MLIISDAQVRSLVTMEQAIALMRNAFTSISGGTSVRPLRTTIDIPMQEGKAIFMPVYVPALECFGAKIVGVFQDNQKVGLPNIQGKIILFSAKNGTPVCLVDAAYITALRTGAASGLATDLLAKKDSRVLAVFGTGVQARTQVQGVSAVRKLEEVLVFGISESHANGFASQMTEEFGLKARSAKRNDLKNADIICTATNSRTPVFDPGDVKKGCHINAIGAFTSEMQEVPDETVVSARIFVDEMEAALAEAGDILIPIKKKLIDSTAIRGELGQVVAGSVEGRLREDDITIFKSVGNAVQDLFVGHYVMSNF